MREAELQGRLRKGLDLATDQEAEPLDPLIALYDERERWHGEAKRRSEAATAVLDTPGSEAAEGHATEAWDRLQRVDQRIAETVPTTAAGALRQARVMSTFEEGGDYSQADAEGFIRLNALRLRLRARTRK